MGRRRRTESWSGKRQDERCSRSARSITPPTTVAYAPRKRPGAWVPTPPAFRPALDPGWGHVTPFLLRSGSQFRPGPPPALTSSTYARDFDESMQVGSANEHDPHAEPDEPGALLGLDGAADLEPGCTAARGLARLGVIESGEAVRVLNAAGADAFIGSWDAKFTYGQGVRSPRSARRTPTATLTRQPIRLDAAPADAAVPRLPGRTHHITPAPPRRF